MYGALQTGISGVVVSREDGYMYCRFVSPTSMSLTHVAESHDDHHAVRNISAIELQTKTLDMNEDMYVFIAVGDLYDGEQQG